MENNNFHLLTTFARSFDGYHVSQKIIHLVCSVFYTCQLDLRTFIRNYRSDSPIFIIQVLPSLASSDSLLLKGVELFDVSPSIIVFHVSFDNFLDITNLNSSKGFESVIEAIAGGKDLDNKKSAVKDFGNILNRTLFIFSGIGWAEMQLGFRSVGVNISGGTISKRQYISTSQFRLMSFLIRFGYQIDDIYKSFDISKKTFDRVAEYNSDDRLNSLYKRIINKKNSEIESELLTTKNNLESYISKSKLDIISLERDITKEVESKSSSIKVNSSKRILKMRKRLLNLKESIIAKEKELFELNSHISELLKNHKSLNDLSSDEIKKLYFKNHHDDKVFNSSRLISRTIKKTVFDYRSRFPSNRRFYSSSSR